VNLLKSANGDLPLIEEQAVPPSVMSESNEVKSEVLQSADDPLYSRNVRAIEEIVEFDCDLSGYCQEAVTHLFKYIQFSSLDIQLQEIDPIDLLALAKIIETCLCDSHRLLLQAFAKYAAAAVPLPKG
jgi:hypothetical protein